MEQLRDAQRLTGQWAYDLAHRINPTHRGWPWGRRRGKLCTVNFRHIDQGMRALGWMATQPSWDRPHQFSVAGETLTATPQALWDTTMLAYGEGKVSNDQLASVILAILSIPS